MSLTKMYFEKLSNFEQQFFSLNFLLAEYHKIKYPSEDKIANERKISSIKHQNFDYEAYSFYKYISTSIEEFYNEK